MRLAPQALARVALIATLAAGAGLAGCTRTAVHGEWRLDPAAPLTGRDTLVTVSLRDNRGTLVPHAKLTVEGHMSHPGMAPLVAPVEERATGEYVARVRFPMAGDWILVLAGSGPDGRSVTIEQPVPNVRDATPSDRVTR